MDLESSRARASERFHQILERIDQGRREAQARSPFVATPEAFFELFLVCLSWQFNPHNYRGNWTTVDKVARVLFLETIITRPQRRKLSTDKRVQAVFKRHATFMYGGGSDGAIHEKTAIVISLDQRLDINPERMLRDCRIYLTLRGAKMAEGFAPKYARVITRERYEKQLERDEEFRERYHGRHLGIVMSNYAAKVEREVNRHEPDDDEEDGNLRPAPARAGARKRRKS